MDSGTGVVNWKMAKWASMDQNETAMIFNDSYERVINRFGKSGEFFSAFYALDRKSVV